MPSINFEFRDLSSNFLASEITPFVKLTPVYAPIISGSVIYPADPVTEELDENSSATIENVIPNIYTAEVWTNKIETTFQLLVPNDAPDPMDAADYILNDFTGSNSSNSFRLVPVPENTGSAGKNGYVALSTDYVYIYSGGIWKRMPIILW